MSKPLQQITRFIPVLQGFLVGVSCLLAQNALANPTQTTPLINKSSILPTGEKSDPPCPAFTPIANALAPNVSPSQDEKVENLPSPTSSCAADLTGVPSVTLNDLESTPLLRGEGLRVRSAFHQNQGPYIAEGNSQESRSNSDPALSSTESITETDSQDSTAQSPDNSPNSKEQTQPAEESDRWHFSFQPYATLPLTTYGQVTVKGRTLNYHLSLNDLLNNLTFTVSGRFEAWKSNWGFIIDAYYVDLNGVANVRRRQTTLESSLNFNQGIYDFAFSYHLGAPAQDSRPERPSDKKFPLVWFEPIAGVRLNDINSTIEASLNFERFGRTFERSVSNGRTWFEPMVGGKLGVQVSDPVTLWVRGDVSGFGLAGDTDLSWNVLFGMDWWVSRKISLQLAYRFYQINYGNGSGNNAFVFEENFNGPFLSATFHF